MNYYLILPLLLSLAACKTDYEGQQPTPTDPAAAVPVHAITLAPATAPLPLQAGGTVATKNEARLSFKVGGIVDAVYVREGATVRRGQLLASLKTTEIDAQVRQATQSRDKLARDLARTQRLYADSAATYETVQNLETALEVASSDLEIAGFNQQYAKIYAPIGGRIAKRLSEPGELVGAGNPLLLIVGNDRSDYVLRVGVADRAVLHLAPGDSATVTLDAYPNRPLPATVTEIAATADPTTGTFEVELTLQPGDRSLRIGFVGRAKIYPSAQPPYYRIPLDALVEGVGQRVTVFTLTPDGHAERHEVTALHLQDSTFTVATDALPAGTAVVTAGAAYLTDGQAVTR